MSLVVTGSIGIDTIETPTGKADEVVGGSSIYFTAAASFFGPVKLVGAVGEDFPQAFVDLFHHWDVDTTGLERRMGSKTFRWHGKYHTNMNDRDTLGIELGVLAEKLPPVPDSYRDAKHIFLATTTPQNQMSLLDSFPNRKLTVADTIELYIQTDRDALLELYSKIDGVIINDSEAKLLTGEANTIVAADRIIEMGPKFVVVKKGEHGAFIRHRAQGRDGFAAFPAYPARSVVDPTGAGDSFAAGMMGYLAASVEGTPTLEDLRRAMAYGTVVASYTIEDFSVGRLKTLTRKEIDTRFTEFVGMVGL